MAALQSLFENREFQIAVNAFWPMLKQGLIYSIPLTLVSFVLGMIIAILSALLIINRIPILSRVMRFYVWVFRGTPLLVQLFIVYWGICNPLKISNLVACVIALSLNVGAYASETIRAAILSIDRGQWEAGYSIGMTYQQAFWRIIAPQAAKVSVPPLFNTFISLVKDTSLASNIMIVEMFRKAQEFAASSLRYLLIYSEAALIYLVFCTLLTGVQKLCEKRLRVGK